MGGDLNMKKHFHPLTMENLERVWKAEEKKRKEEEQCLQLQQELAEERQREQLQKQAVESGLIKKKTEKLDWMYSGQQAVNTEEYLLGKKIDKHVEVMKDDDAEKNIIEGNILKKPILQPKASDILAKVKEDPLFLIKKREEENRKELVQNPIKMRKLKALLQSHEKEKKKKKSKKSKKEKYDEDYRYTNGRSEKDLSKTEYDSKHGIKYSKERSDEKYDSRYSTHNFSNRDLQTHESNKHSSRNYDSSNHHSSHRYEQPFKNARHENSEKYYENAKSKNSQDSSKVHRRDSESSRGDHRGDKEYRTQNKSKRKRSLSSSSDDESDLEKQRQFMMQNAKWRKEQRIKNLRSHEEETIKEEETVKSVLSKSNVNEDKARFIKKLQVASYSSDTTASVEDRIKRNIHTKQRTKADLEKKFTSR
ncbi:pre-mRNA-splicing factor CWC25 homolog [Hydra vulgaris]|uniref:pre-mRNA-splicing factor CWC25 homolog n=1 Tax=Hydra vulgaris TaxID=6087 RepID=UPI001F5F5F01|nr:pre-mRNA-splicing factor CWC25 homolog [Hydra vulgaris]